MTLTTLADYLAELRHITVLTGAGISAPSGVATFRPGGKVAIVDGRPVEEISSAAMWKKKPQVTWEYYLDRMAEMARVDPNPAHRALAELGQKKTVQVFTQNLDDLHERGGSESVEHFHGVANRFVCTFCDKVYGSEDIEWETKALKWCECGYRVRPDIVLFGEQLPQAPFEAIEDLLAKKKTEILLVVGTSLNVSPVNMLPSFAMDQSIPVWEINMELTQFAPAFTGSIRGGAERVLPHVIRKVLDR